MRKQSPHCDSNYAITASLGARESKLISVHVGGSVIFNVYFSHTFIREPSVYLRSRIYRDNALFEYCFQISVCTCFSLVNSAHYSLLCTRFTLLRDVVARISISMRNSAWKFNKPEERF